MEIYLICTASLPTAIALPIELLSEPSLTELLEGLTELPDFDSPADLPDGRYFRSITEGELEHFLPLADLPNLSLHLVMPIEKELPLCDILVSHTESPTDNPGTRSTEDTTLFADCENSETDSADPAEDKITVALDSLPTDTSERDVPSALPSPTGSDDPNFPEETVESGQPETAEVKKEGLISSIFDWFEVLAIALVSVLCLVNFVARQSPVEGSSMYPTLIGHSSASSIPEYGLESGYDVLLISNLFYTPKRSDIVIIQEPSQPTEPIVKRIIAVGGDTVRINFTTWEVTVNGTVLEEDYVNKKDELLSPQRLPVDQNNCWEGTVPEGSIFVLGDNRAVSKDSRTFGFIDERYIIGRVVGRIAPLSRFGLVD